MPRTTQEKKSTSVVAKKILIAEDEKPIARALQLKLTSVGFDVDLAEDGEVALKKMAQNTYDLVLLDLIMPKKDGFTVLTELKARGNKTPIIVSSNLSQEEDSRRAAALGAKDYFIKSDISIATVVEKIKKILGS